MENAKGVPSFSSLENNWKKYTLRLCQNSKPQALETFLEKITSEDPELMKVITIYQQDEFLSWVVEFSGSCGS